MTADVVPIRTTPADEARRRFAARCERAPVLELEPERVVIDGVVWEPSEDGLVQPDPRDQSGEGCSRTPRPSDFPAQP